MRKIIRKYRQMSFEQKTILKTIIGMCGSTLLACGKFIVGLFSDYTLCIIAAYTFAILLAKLECVLGAKSSKRTFRTRNLLIGVFLFISSIVYIVFMVLSLFEEHKIKSHSLNYVVLLAFISFVELGLSIIGIFKTKNKGHFYRDIKIINFCVALIAILTTQITILDFTTTENTAAANAYSGIGIGVFIAICTVYITIAPKIGIVGREYNSFELKQASMNKLVNIEKSSARIMLCKSGVYGSFVFDAKIDGNTVSGNIKQEKSLWKRMNIILKIFCCILSELLIFAWLFGRIVLFFRSINLPQRLERKMLENGFIKIETTYQN